MYTALENIAAVKSLVRR